MADKIVRGATPKTAPSLCERCINGTHVRGQNFEEIMFCHDMRRDIPFPVDTCSSFEDRSKASLYDMKKIAWNVESRVRGRTGFTVTGSSAEIEITPPKKREDEQPSY